MTAQTRSENDGTTASSSRGAVTGRGRGRARGRGRVRGRGEEVEQQE